MENKPKDYFGISSDDNTEKVMQKYPVIYEFFRRCHGSGIDYDWSATENKKELHLRNAFHVMNENGFYCATCDFTIHIPKDDIHGFVVKCSNNRYYWNRNQLGEYLADTISWALGESIGKLNTGMPYKDGFREVKRFELTPVVN